MKYPEDFINKVICGDCFDIMPEIPDKSVDMILTSPPYDNLRTYNGYTFNFEGISKEIYRLLKDGGVCVWIVGDATIKGSETGTSFKQALYFKDIGFNLHDTMIYEKLNPIPLSHNRYENIFEYMFVFSKGRPTIFNPIRCSTKGGVGIYNSKTKESAVRKIGIKIDVKSEKIKGNIWGFGIGGRSVSGTHPAPFPEKLAEDHILSWSNEGDTVLDPFAGSGTTLKMAKKNNRNFIGIEISEKYCKIAEDRLRQQMLL